MAFGLSSSGRSVGQLGGHKEREKTRRQQQRRRSKKQRGSNFEKVAKAQQFGVRLAKTRQERVQSEAARLTGLLRDDAHLDAKG